MADDRVLVWVDGDHTVQHLASPPDDTQMEWSGESACALDGQMRRVTYENVDWAIACQRCTAEPYNLAGDSRGLP